MGFGRLTLGHASLAHNSAGSVAPPANAMGGGVYAESRSAMSLNRNTIRDNTATGNGGGLYVRHIGSGQTTITDSRILNNSAGMQGGGVRFRNGRLDISDSAISGNSAG